MPARVGGRAEGVDLRVVPSSTGRTRARRDKVGVETVGIDSGVGWVAGGA